MVQYLMSLKLIIMTNYKRLLNCDIMSGDIVFLFKFYLYDINRGIRIDPHYGLVEINKKDRLPTSLMFLLYIYSFIKKGS